MIGTNNLEKRVEEDIFKGILNIIKLIFEKQPNIELIIYGLPPRSDIKIEKIKEVNSKIQEHVKDLKNIKYRYFGDQLENEDYDDNVHLSRSGYKKWFIDLKNVL